MRAAIYLRISRDPEGLELGVQRQEQDIRQYALTQGYELVATFKDNDLSASTRSLKRRPDYERMLDAAKHGEFQVVLAYTSSRLTRRPRENEDLIQLAELHGVKFRYLRSPSFDLNTADGRNVARILAANDAAEAERISERVARAAAQRAQQGGFHGGACPFGYVQNGTERSVDPASSALLLEAARRLLSGETLYGICTDWNSRSLRTRAGTVWRSKTLKGALLNPALISKRQHNGVLHDAKWPRIFDDETFQRLSILLTDSSRLSRAWPGQDTSRKYALSGLVYCSCGKRLGSMTGRRKPDEPLVPAFFCSKMATGGCGSVRISMPPLEEWILAQLVSVLDGLTLPQQEKDDSEEQRLRDAILRLEAAIRQATTDHYDGLLDRSEWLEQRARMSGQVQDLRSQLAGLVAQSARTEGLVGLQTSHEFEAQWRARDNMWRRTVAASLIERITVAPHPKGMPTNLTPRKNESQEDYAQRREDLLIQTLQSRVSVSWRV
jgi:site-specific DNA recombinase